MRGLGKLNLMAILKKILFGMIAGPMGMIIGGGSIMTMIAAFVLRPIVEPHLQRLLGSIQSTTGRLGSGFGVAA